MKKILLCLYLTLLFFGTSIVVQAEEAKKEKDNTGTNPINFTHDLRLYYNFAQLNVEGDDPKLVGDGTSQTITLEFRAPIIDGKAQWRMRVRTEYKEIDFNDDGEADFDESGVGAMDFRFLTVPYLNMEKKFALAAGLEVFLDTANDPELRSGSTSLGPQLFAVFFKPPGGGALVAPAYQHVLEVDGKGVNRTQLDIFYLYLFKTPYINWLLVNPQGVWDYNNEKDSWNIDSEAGKMLTKNLSFYVRPGLGIGSDRVFDWDIEGGLKYIW
jgi:hypothetical protein